MWVWTTEAEIDALIACVPPAHDTNYCALCGGVYPLSGPCQGPVNERNNNLLAIEISTLRLTIKTLETQLALSKTKKALKKARGPRP